MQEAGFYSIGFTVFKVYRISLYYPLAGMIIGAVSAGLIIKLVDAYNFKLLSQILHKCYNFADRTKLARVILCVIVLVGCYWNPLIMFFTAAPLTFINTVYGIRNIQINRK